MWYLLFELGLKALDNGDALLKLLAVAVQSQLKLVLFEAEDFRSQTQFLNFKLHLHIFLLRFDLLLLRTL